VPISKGAATFSVITGALIIALWSILFATGQVSGIVEEPLSYVFHLASETVTAALLLVCGLVGLRQSAQARRLFYFAGGMLLLAAAGMVVFYVVHWSLPFVVLGIVVAALTLLFLRRNYSVRSDAVYLALGTILYLQFNVLGNLLQMGDAITAAYVGVSALLTLPVTLLLLTRPL